MNEAADFKSAVSTYFTTQAGMSINDTTLLSNKKSPQQGAFRLFLEARPGVEPG